MKSNIHQAQSHEVLRSWQSQRTDINNHNDFVLPMFIGNVDDSIESIESMPGVYRYGCNRAIEYLEPLVYSYGLKSVLLFPVATKPDKTQFTSKDDSDGDDESDASSSASFASSSSSASSYTLQSSSSSDRGQHRSNLPRRAPNPQEPALSSQNPFLNRSEEEDHLLGEPGDIARPPVVKQLLSREATSRSKSKDIKLIKGMALKDQHNPVLRLIPKLRAKFPKLLIICDVCLCAFTSTGHCCLLDDHAAASAFKESPEKRGPQTHSDFSNHFPISNKITCQYLAMLSVEYALRGCNVVAPSDMMDGRILTIRSKLDENRLHHVSILSYSAKFASAFYGPFRQATRNTPEFGDRRAYQLPPGSRSLALKAVQRDVSQGADFIMVKPGGPYLDIVRDIKQKHPDVPIAVYQVSGEYAMLKLASTAGILDLKMSVNEVLTSYRRAGATIIITYFTPELLRGELSLCDA